MQHESVKVPGQQQIAAATQHKLLSIVPFWIGDQRLNIILRLHSNQLQCLGGNTKSVVRLQGDVSLY